MKYLAILCLVLALSCQPQEKPTSLSEAEISAVMEATTQYGAAIVANDLDKMKSLLDEGIIMMPTEATAKNGIEESMDFFATGPSLEGSITPDQVEGSGNLAYVRGNYNLTFIVNDTLHIPDNGKYIEVWKKQEDGSWKVVVDIWNSDISSEM